MLHRPEQVHNHNLSSVTLNYPYPISRPRVVSHNRTKRRVAGPVSRITLCLSYPCRFITYHLNSRWGLDPPWGPGAPPLTFLNMDDGRCQISISTRQGVRRRRFLTLMVGAPRQHLPGGPSSMFLSVDGGRSQILQQRLLGGPSSTFSKRLMVSALGSSGSTSQRACR
jgi:hypothetical protein